MRVKIEQCHARLKKKIVQEGGVINSITLAEKLKMVKKKSIRIWLEPMDRQTQTERF